MTKESNFRIWKWDIEITDNQTIMMPVGAKLLDVQIQAEKAVLWALCNPDAAITPRHIAIYGTGNPVTIEAGEYIATFQMFDGQLVFHAFEVSFIKGQAS